MANGIIKIIIYVDVACQLKKKKSELKWSLNMNINGILVNPRWYLYIWVQGTLGVNNFKRFTSI